MGRKRAIVEEEDDECVNEGKQEDDFIVDDDEVVNDEDDYEEEVEDHDDDDEELVSDEEVEEEPKSRRSKKKVKESVMFTSEQWAPWAKNKPTLDEIASMVKDLASTTRPTEKVGILVEHKMSIMALIYATHPYWIYNIKSKSLVTKSAKAMEGAKHVKDVFHLLDLLKGGLTGNAARATCLAFIAKNKKHEGLIKDMIDKKLKTRCKAASINKVFENLIPSFKVALAEPHHKFAKSVNFETEVWWQARKFDGARILTIIDENGEMLFYSRKKKQILTLGVVEKNIKALGLKSVVLDGEICKMVGNLESYQGIMQELLKKDHTMPNPKYYVFDMLTLEEFNAALSQRVYGKRYLELLKAIPKSSEPVLSVVEQKRIKSSNDVSEYMSFALKNGWEGLILRKDTIYEGKRSRNMLKVKQFEDEEFTVTNYTMNSMRKIINGKDTTMNMLASVDILLDGKYTVSVGTGFSDDQRIEYGANPKLIQGMTITVQHNGRTTDQYGSHSLRFPSFKGLHGKKRVL